MDGNGAAPARRAHERDRDWTRRKQQAFLSHLACNLNVAAAALSVSMSEASVYRLRARSAAFRAGWEAALREGYARLEVAMLERAIVGTAKSIVRAGKVVGETTEYADRLALALLAAHRAASGDERAPEGDAEAVRRRIEAKLADMNLRLGGKG